MSYDDYIDLALGTAPPVLSTEDTAGGDWTGAIGLLANLCAEINAQATRAPWVRHPDGAAYDAYDPLSNEQGQLFYPNEDRADREFRVGNALVTAPFRGVEQFMIDELTSAGYPGATFDYSRIDTGPRGEPGPWWSQFWIQFYEPAFSIDLTPVVSDDWVIGDTEAIAGDNIDVETIREIIQKYKPGLWICRAVEFTSGPVIGDDLIIGDAFELEAGTYASFAITG